MCTGHPIHIWDKIGVRDGTLKLNCTLRKKTLSVKNFDEMNRTVELTKTKKNFGKFEPPNTHADLGDIKL